MSSLGASGPARSSSSDPTDRSAGCSGSAARDVLPFGVGRDPDCLTILGGATSITQNARCLVRYLIFVLMLAWAAPSVAQTVSEKLEAGRRQFAYGRHLVDHCANVIHDPRSTGSCETRAVWWNQDGCCVPSVPNAIQWGAQYQILVLESRAGLQRLSLNVYQVVQTIFRGDANTYCAFFAVDCEPVLKNFSINKNTYVLLYGAETKPAKK